MASLVHVEDKAVDRLAELGLTVEIVERVVRRADAEVSTCTALDPPIMEGLTRWGRTNLDSRRAGCTGVLASPTWLTRDDVPASTSLPESIPVRF
jgi:hypothetical protein